MPVIVQPHVPSRRRQRGVGLLELSLILVLLGLAAAIAMVWLRAEQPRQAADAEVEALRWADQSLIAFAAAQGRLPCPARLPGGSEDCTLSGKGYLPAETLRLSAAGFAPGAERLRAAAGGVAGLPLAAPTLSDLFQPTGVDARKFDFGTVNELDFCSALGSAAGTTAPSTFAHVRSDGSDVAVAYAIASPGPLDADGDGDPFDGVNANGSTEIAHPALTPGLDYDDRSLARDFTTLAAGLGCSTTQLSLDAMALAVGAAEEVQSLKEGLVLTGAALTAVSTIKTLISIAKLAKAAIALADAFKKLSASAAALAAAIGTCVVAVGCALIPTMTAAVAASVAAIALGAVAVAANATAAALGITAAALTLSVAIEAGVSPDELGETPDYSAAIADICGAVELARAEVDRATASLAQATQAADAALADRDSKWTALLDHAQAVYEREQAAYDADQQLTPPGPAPPPQDRAPLLDAVRDTASARDNADLVRSQAISDRNAASRRLSDLRDALAQNQAQLDAATDPDEIARLQDAIASLQQQIAIAESELAQTTAALNEAQAAFDAATEAFNDARQAAIDSYSGGDRGTATGHIDAFVEAQQAWIGLEAVRRVRERELAEAETARQQAEASCTAIQALANGEGGADATEFGVWNGAESILRRADQRGTVQ